MLLFQLIEVRIFLWRLDERIVRGETTLTNPHGTAADDWRGGDKLTIAELQW